ncbi:MAG: hypothetical protein FWG87_14090 [Defluviitaleaceae bacterium]|nr:hypothetical protein [Defluviitaleaceae bacterium]
MNISYVSQKPISYCAEEMRNTRTKAQASASINDIDIRNAHDIPSIYEKDPEVSLLYKYNNEVGFGVFNGGIEDGFMKFEKLINELNKTYEGEELRKHIAAATEVFKGSVRFFASSLASYAMKDAGWQRVVYRPGEMSAEEIAAAREQEQINQQAIHYANKIRKSVTEILLSAVNFILDTGSFKGFTSSSLATNRLGDMSFKDIEEMVKKFGM